MEAKLGMGGGLAARKIARQRPGWTWLAWNGLLHVWPAYWRHVVANLLGIPHFFSQLEMVQVCADGRRMDYGTVGTRQVTDAFVAALATYMFDASGTAPTAYDYHASGTGTTAEAASQTALVTDSGISRAAGTPTNPSAGLYRSVGTQSYTSALAITEHGLFSASSSGTMLDRTVFSAVNVVSGDSIQFTYTLTISSGG